MLIHRDDEDEPVEVDAESVELQDDDPYLTQDEVDSVVQKRVSRARRTARKELKADENFFQEAAQERGYDFNDEGELKGSTNDEELKQLRKEKAQLEERASRADELESQVEHYRKTGLENQVLKHASGVHEGAEDDVLRIAQDRMTWDEEEERHVLTGEDGEVVFNANGEPAGAETLLDELEESKPYLFEQSKFSDGPEDEPGGSPSGKKTWSESEHASADPASMDEETFQDWKTAADEDRIQ
jgi:hypothetical protein